LLEPRLVDLGSTLIHVVVMESKNYFVAKHKNITVSYGYEGVENRYIYKILHLKTASDSCF